MVRMEMTEINMVIQEMAKEMIEEEVPRWIPMTLLITTRKQDGEVLTMMVTHHVEEAIHPVEEVIHQVEEVKQMTLMMETVLPNMEMTASILMEVLVAKAKMVGKRSDKHLVPS